MIYILAIICGVSFFLIIQSLFSLVWMLYAWENPRYMHTRQSPKQFAKPMFSFTALVPARFEEKVIADTILAISAIDYPEDLKEVFILCREDDTATIKKVENLLRNTRMLKKNVKLITFDGYPINKPHSLNVGLNYATKDIVVVFDAEDQPHKDIYSVANTRFQQNDISVLQSGVQLINYKSKWFSLLNVLEYYFWFKSGLHFFSKVGNLTLLAGNTVFFNRQLLNRVNGWDENCLTEDAEITFRLLNAGGKIDVIYDEKHVTLEETPQKLSEFVRQRTRWDQGFLQVFSKMEWIKLSSLRQKILSSYILLSPLMQFLLLLYVPFSLWATLFFKIPLVVAMFSLLPFYFFSMQLFLNIIGFIEFNKAFRLHAPWWTFLKIIITFYPYQIILAIASLRACYRNLLSVNQWEKTKHTNLHRDASLRPVPLSYA